ncbi:MULTISPECIES: haloacid dehalogenase type II [Saccharopolyspora]|uniref:Haloacid dehalogenase type II n=1 Tax=Saccharopolyspora gregorii TaxID=33914 RepID=A0ABP6RW68_9PSEU|nr:MULTISPECIES: haloacid dehalogenase type II [Saccharopolyspora]MCA1190004.1 haloacid dehalogenase type II [Saccharopolyspora sp. 6T]MCA1192600.1 haloacid dehalogenase type II [Saccharopolyspora sp. 6V]MCA1226645.1 haloacid dehalogenase type II [Saccharopolyspora sp. 6M]MCA1278943.1 haloacid dehalogenase type II [Saccharopolyspora sp. 7B]
MLDDVRVVAFDIFGTAVDWYSGITEQVGAVFADRGVELDPAAFAESWRGRYLPAMARVDRGEREWAYLDALHRESLDDLLAEHGVAGAMGEDDRARLVRAWHRLPAWPDSADLVARLRARYTVVVLSNGGFRLLTDLVKAAGLTFDAITSAELARSYKPSPAAYLTTARLLDVAPHQLLLVAAHRWDVDGARAAGLRTAFLERPGEKGPHREADRAADVTCDIAATSAAELATRLGC